MEPDRPATLSSEATSAADLRALTRLRDRVVAAVSEIERLREENRTLATRIATLQSEVAPNREDSTLPLFAEDDDSEGLKARLQGFIATIDQLLATSDDDSAA